MAVAKNNIISDELADLFLELDDDISTLDTNREPSGNTDLEGRGKNKATSATRNIPTSSETYLYILKCLQERILFQFFNLDDVPL